LDDVRAESSDEVIRGCVVPLLKTPSTAGNVKSRNIIVYPNGDGRAFDRCSDELVFGHGLDNTLDERQPERTQFAPQLGFTPMLKRA
jgi:hypothetical protein